MSPEKLVYMANQIGKFFAHQGEDKASAAIANHLVKYWDPRMRQAISSYMQNGGSGLEPAVSKAVQSLEPVRAPDAQG